MSDVIIFDNVNSPNPVLQYLQNQDDPLFSGRADVILRPDLSQVAAQPLKYWKVTQRIDAYHGTIVAMSAQEQAAVDAAAVAAFTASQRSAAQADLVSASDLGKLIRAEVDIIVTQLNLHTTWEAATTAAVAAATSLSDLKTRWAAITSVSSVTLAQAKSAILNDISSGGEGD